MDADGFCEVVTMPMMRFREYVRSGDLTDADVAWMCLDRLRPWKVTGAEGLHRSWFRGDPAAEARSGREGQRSFSDGRSGSRV